MIKDLAAIKEKEEYKGYKGKFINSQKMTVAYWEIKKDSVLPEHSHPQEQIANIIKGKYLLIIGTNNKVLEPGNVAIIPPNTVHSGRAITNCSIIDVFSPP